MSWRAVIAAVYDEADFPSSVPLYLHPLAGRPIVLHLVAMLAEADPAPEEVVIVHHGHVSLDFPASAAPIRTIAVPRGETLRGLRAAVTPAGMVVLMDGAAPLLDPRTIARIQRAGEHGVAALSAGNDGETRIAVGGEGPALASAEDPRRPEGATRVEPTLAEELIVVRDRITLTAAGIAVRNRLVRHHQRQGVTFLLPDSVWIDADVRIGKDTVIYPGVVIEGASRIGGECVIGPHCRIIESVVGRGVEMKGWNYLSRTEIRNHAVLEPYVRRGLD